MVSFLARVKISRFWPKRMDYSPCVLINFLEDLTLPVHIVSAPLIRVSPFVPAAVIEGLAGAVPVCVEITGVSASECDVTATLAISGGVYVCFDLILCVNKLTYLLQMYYKYYAQSYSSPIESNVHCDWHTQHSLLNSVPVMIIMYNPTSCLGDYVCLLVQCYQLIYIQNAPI